MARPMTSRVKLIGGLMAVVMLGGAITAYQVSRRGAPSFRRGGLFAAGQALGATTTSAPRAALDSAPGADFATASGGAASSTTALRAVPTTVAPSVTAPSPARAREADATTPATSAARPPGPVLPGLPAFGTYTYALDGEEEASFFGTRRFPDHMTISVHGAPGLEADQVVADLRYSDSHEEREIIGYRTDGVYIDFAGGSISYGPMTETSEGDFDPPALQVRQPPVAGAIQSGVSRYKDADGSVTNTVDWRVSVSGQEHVTVAGGSVLAWKARVSSKTRPGPADQVSRQRTYWYDPGRSWVKFSETTHGSRKVLGGTLTYDANLTATLIGFTAS